MPPAADGYWEPVITLTRDGRMLVDGAGPRVLFCGTLLLQLADQQAHRVAEPYLPAAELELPYAIESYDRIQSYDPFRCQLWVNAGALMADAPVDAEVWADAFTGAVLRIRADTGNLVYMITGFDEKNHAYVGEWPE